MRLAALAAALAAVLAGGVARAQDDVLSGTLKTIHDRGTILIAVRADAVPFAFRNGGGQPIGFSVDLCHAIAADVAAVLNSDLLEPDAPNWAKGIRIAYVPVTADARLPTIIAGGADLECGSTTATIERAKSVAFSPVFFLAGTRIAVGTASGAQSYRDIHSVAVAAETTNAAVVKALAANTTPPPRVVETPDIVTAFDRLAAGSVDAVASDDVLLAGSIASRADGRSFKLVGDFLSFEPYALVYRRDDPAFAQLVKDSFARMAERGILATRYRRWFTDRLPSGETMNLPMSAQLSEMYRALGQPD